MLLQSKEDLVAYTHSWQGERFEDGRPKVPDEILKRMELATIEEAWTVLRNHGYHSQFEGNWYNLHPKRVLAGRAVTAAFTPLRPDLQEAIQAVGEREGRIGGQNSWVIDTLVEGDVIVVDLFGKVKDGTFAGDNLATSIATRTKRGMVIHGGIRDLAGIYPIPDFGVFVRGVDPSAIADVTLMSINLPIRINQVTVLPGDVVLGTREGVIFIPPHLAEEVVEHSKLTRLRDEFGHQRLREGRYTPGEIDRPWTPEIQADFDEWRRDRGL